MARFALILLPISLTSDMFFRGGDGFATRFVLGHGAINLMVTGLTLYAEVAGHPFSPPALGPNRILSSET